MELVDQGRLSMDCAIRALTCNPARIIGIDAGHLSRGAVADICLYDPKNTWRLDNETMQSRGRNSPFMNREFKGKVVHTLVNGKTVYAAEA